MKEGKSLGIDGFPCEFYNVMWDILGENFYNLAHELFSTRSLSKTLN
jgi:hypothetical protein